jgi:hypothetical protein
MYAELSDLRRRIEALEDYVKLFNKKLLTFLETRNEPMDTGEEGWHGVV